MKTCPICLQAYSDEVEFCARDGALLSGEAREERECPFCAERILKKARVCKHCGRDVEPLIVASAAVETPAAPSAQRSAAPAPTERSPCPPAPPQQVNADVVVSSRPLEVARSRPPVPEKLPQFEIIPDPPSKLKYVLMGLGALILVVAAVWLISHHGAKKGEVRTSAIDGLKYVWVPPGTFTMGCSPGDNECYDFEKPTNLVSISKGFWLAQTEVTVGAYKRFASAAGRQMPPEPSLEGRPLNPGWSDESLPIVEVTWDDAQAYCRWVGGRLPTEAEWEYAARAGSTAARYDLLDDIAWFADNSGAQHLDSQSLWKKDTQADFQKLLNQNGNNMHAVGQKRANALGLFDMLGNVWEWEGDWWDPRYYRNIPPQDPTGPTNGTERIMRGGSWMGGVRDIRVSLRNRRIPSDKDIDLGFRCGGDMDLP
jgi:formylglycine-generating enzyme required for sulfatase activity